MSVPSLSAMAAAALLSGLSAAHGGPCTGQISQLERQFSLAQKFPEIGPRAAQTVGAQLHWQPTPEAVERAAQRASALVDAALERARSADAGGNASACAEALNHVKRLYSID